MDGSEICRNTAPAVGRRWMEVTEVRLIDANRLYDAAEEKYMEDRSKTDNVITRAKCIAL